ncbi:MAG: hypothetical protein ACHQT9_02980 [Candidatus Saccharimonadales bacterium]
MTALCVAGEEDINMNEDSTYNGWSNRETWLANLWLTNEEPFANLLMEASKHSDDEYIRAAWLENHFYEKLDELFDDASLWRDLLGTAVSHVNWYEIVDNN